jgi:hypothetical protein
MKIVRCCDCVWWQEGQDHEHGECHRRAPRPELFSAAQGTRADVFWPPTMAKDGCGEGADRD